MIGTSGLYRAIVVDTKDFKETGTILVNILGISPDDVYEKAYVLTPFGGVPNQGLFMLPSVGSTGYVIFEQGGISNPVWVGGLLQHWGDELKDGYAHPVEAEDSSDIIFKTQYLKPDNQEINSQDNKVETIIKINEKEITLAKVNQTANYEYKKEQYNLLDENNNFNIFHISDDQIILSAKFDNEIKKFIITKDDIKLMNGEDNYFQLTKDELTIVYKNTKLTLKDGKIELEADEIDLGGNSDNGVKYSGLRDFILQVFNNHTHGTPSGPSSPPMNRFTNTSSLKSEKVKLQ